VKLHSSASISVPLPSRAGEFELTAASQACYPSLVTRSVTAAACGRSATYAASKLNPASRAALICRTLSPRIAVVVCHRESRRRHPSGTPVQPAFGKKDRFVNPCCAAEAERGRESDRQTRRAARGRKSVENGLLAGNMGENDDAAALAAALDVARSTRARHEVHAMGTAARPQMSTSTQSGPRIFTE
jgi:hypothetical protein